LLSPRQATVALADDSTVVCDAVAELVASREHRTLSQVQVTLSSSADAVAFIPGACVRAVIHVPAAEVLSPSTASPVGIESEALAAATSGNAESQFAVSSPKDSAAKMVLAVLESAVVDHGHEQLVYVESMPGTFDAMAVTLGRRCGDYYPVLQGLQAGQQVAAAGAFLIDAEARLNPSLTAAYFGAQQNMARARVPEVRVAAGATPAAAQLSPEDRGLATRQGICPVTELPLDSMGGPVMVMVERRKVFLCCKSCEAKLRRDPQAYLVKLPQT
jgi:hypothetical protein